MPLKVVPRRDRKFHRVVKQGDTRTLRKGEILYRPGDPAQELILVRSGHIRLTAPQGVREGRVVAIAGPWEVVGEEALRPGQSRRYGAVAGEGTLVTILGGSGARRALQTSEKTFQAFLAAQEADLAFGRTLAGLRKPGGTRKRLGLLLLHLGERLGRAEEKGIRIPLRLTHQLLADLTVINRSTVTTILNDWVYRGHLVEESGFLVIREGEGLE
jgi:CRP-like cAMP-binding protein